jgi:hypothetical protein
MSDESEEINSGGLLKRYVVMQPRTQALSTTRLAGGKTLVQAGHVSPRFWEITKFLRKGGGLSFILPI